MEINGKIVSMLPVQSGEGRNGTWRKQEFILETHGQYPKKVCISMWGDKIDQFSLSEGEEVNVSINLESREYNGRWYTDVRAWKVDRSGELAPPPPPPGEDPGELLGTDEETDDLPF
jgi:hypothetical protein